MQGLVCVNASVPVRVSGDFLCLVPPSIKSAESLEGMWGGGVSGCLEGMWEKSRGFSKGFTVTEWGRFWHVTDAKWKVKEISPDKAEPHKSRTTMSSVLLVIRAKCLCPCAVNKRHDLCSRIQTYIVLPQSCCTIPHMNAPEISSCVVVNVPERRISHCVVRVWKENRRGRVWTQFCRLPVEVTSGKRLISMQICANIQICCFISAFLSLSPFSLFLSLLFSPPQEKNLEWFPRMRAMSLVSSEGDGEQNEMRSLQHTLDGTVTLVAQLSGQLAELKEQVECHFRPFVMLRCAHHGNPPVFKKYISKKGLAVYFTVHVLPDLETSFTLKTPPRSKGVTWHGLRQSALPFCNPPLCRAQ